MMDDPSGAECRLLSGTVWMLAGAGGDETQITRQCAALPPRRLAGRGRDVREPRGASPSDRTSLGSAHSVRGDRSRVTTGRRKSRYNKLTH